MRTPGPQRRTISQFYKILELPDDVTDLSPREFWTQHNGNSHSTGTEIADPVGEKGGQGEMVVAIVGDFHRQKVLQRTLPWYYRHPC